jgi:predicted transcriptional regulator
LDKNMKNFKSFLKEEEYERFVQNNSQNVDIKKTTIFKYKDVTIMLIDGEEVRNKISVDFTMGGHEFVYDYVPENEVWIEDLKSDFDKLCTIIHELVERYIMGKYGTEYEEAHDIATKVEYQIRKKKELK